MLTAPTLEKLHALKLDALAAAWTDQQQHADATALAGIDSWVAWVRNQLGKLPNS